MIGALAELRKLNVDVDAPMLPNVPEVKSKAPDTPNPPPILVLPDTPKPPNTVSAPDVDDVEFVL